MAFAPPEIPLQRDILESSWPSESFALSAAPSRHPEAYARSFGDLTLVLPDTFASYLDAPIERTTLVNVLTLTADRRPLSAIPAHTSCSSDPMSVSPLFRLPLPAFRSG